MLTKHGLHKLFLLAGAIIVLHGTLLVMIVDGQFRVGALRFFTIISNLLVSIGFALMLVLYNKRGAYWHFILINVMVSISATALGYNLVLVPFGGANTILSDYPNFATHLLAAVLAVMNYIIFEKKGFFRLRHILAAMVIPFLYFVIFLSIGHIIDFYPYFFMNPHVIGWPMVFVWCGVMFVFLFLFGLLILLLDRIL